MQITDQIEKVLRDQGFINTPDKVWVASYTGRVTETVTYDDKGNWHHRDVDDNKDAEGVGPESLLAHLEATAP